jgi:hypothetical protein
MLPTAVTSRPAICDQQGTPSTKHDTACGMKCSLWAAMKAATATAHGPSSLSLLRDLGTWRREPAVSLPAKHVVEQAEGQQLANAAQPHEP